MHSAAHMHSIVDLWRKFIRQLVSQRPKIFPLVSASRGLFISSLFDLNEDGFRHVLSWLDVDCICKLDIAIGNADQKLLWLHSLHTMNSKAIDEYAHGHSSMRWLISRGARATEIRTKGTNLESDRITDQTFAGIGLLCVHNVDTSSANGIQIHSGARYSLRNREIKADTNKVIAVRPRSCRHLISINLAGCGSKIGRAS